MTQLRASAHPLILATLVLLATTSPGHAYLDPGTGSMILQGLLGGAAGAFVIGKLYWSKIKRVLGLAKDEPAAEPEQPEGRAGPGD